eukprot:8643074-Prorocentrum_lima.AAC.1
MAWKGQWQGKGATGWWCSLCSTHNYLDRQECRKCGAGWKKEGSKDKGGKASFTPLQQISALAG